MLGLSKIAHHRSKNITLFRHGDINFIINHEPTSHAAFVAEEHGPSAYGLAFRVKGSQYAYNMALDLGVQPISISTRPIELNLPAIKGTGVTPIYLIDCCQDEQSFYDIDFECIGNAPRHQIGSNYTTTAGALDIVVITMKSYLDFVKLGTSILKKNTPD